jgi:hypothetical protein
MTVPRARKPRPPQLAELLSPIVDAIAARVAEVISKPDATDPWVDARSSSLGVRTFRRAAKSGAFPVSHVGRKWVARRSDVDRWIEQNRVDVSRRAARDQEDPLEKALASGRLRAVGGRRR